MYEDTLSDISPFTMETEYIHTDHMKPMDRQGILRSEGEVGAGYIQQVKREGGVN